jgi:hypothetical protein
LLGGLGAGVYYRRDFADILDELARYINIWWLGLSTVSSTGRDFADIHKL